MLLNYCSYIKPLFDSSLLWTPYMLQDLDTIHEGLDQFKQLNKDNLLGYGNIDNWCRMLYNYNWNYMYIILYMWFIHWSVNTTPLLKDIYEYITPQYAADWKVIGTLLGLPSGELNSIEAGWPTNVNWCCNQMLGKWLETDAFASWGKLFTVIESSKKEVYIIPDKGK